MKHLTIQTIANESSSSSYESRELRILCKWRAYAVRVRYNVSLNYDWTPHTTRLTQEESNRCVYNEVDESRGAAPVIGVVYGTEKEDAGTKEEEQPKPWPEPAGRVSE
jgi:hypothetical protein